MSLMNLNPAPTSLFTFLGDYALIEDSTLCRNGYGPDACDVGFAVKSERTGAVMYFHEADEIVEDGEVVAWDYKIIREHRHLCKKPDFYIRVFND